MSLFRRRAVVKGGPVEIPGLAERAASLGLAPVAPECLFDGHLEDRVHETTRAMYGEPRSRTTFTHVVVGATAYHDVYRGPIDGHTVTVANAWTEISTDPRFVVNRKGSSVCAVELPTMLPLTGIEPRSKFVSLSGPEVATGDADFDARYRVVGAPASADVVTAEVRHAVAAHPDWVIVAERYLLGCVSLPELRSADEVAQRIHDVLAVVIAFPSAIVPTRVDHSFDDLLARVARLDSVDDALALLQGLTPDEREHLARSDTPLAAFADVRTPDEAMARLGTLDEGQKMQLFAMFSQAKDRDRHH